MGLSAKARPKSAFVTPTDKYEFTRCPFRLTQAPAYFQRLINKVFAGLDFAFGYLDDILIYSPDVPTHLVHMRQLFQRLREADLKLNREKCNFFKSHIQYLGHLISGEGIEPLPEKLESIKEALTKEAYAIYMSIKKLTYYLENAEITLRSDHLPLKRFLKRNTLNTKVNNWAVEISPFKITFECIKGIKNTLVDTISRLIALDSENQLVDEPEGFEYGYYAFDNIDPIKTQVEINEMTNKMGVETPVNLPSEDITLPIEDNKLIELQKEDKFCKNILNMLTSNKLQNKNPYYVESRILKRYIDDNKQRFEVIILPQTLTQPALQLAHEGLGHNGIPRTYALLRHQYYWKGLKPSVTKHVKQCTLCQKHNKQVVKYNKLHFEASPAPVKFIPDW